MSAPTITANPQKTRATGRPAKKLLDAVTGTGDGTLYIDDGVARSNWAIQVKSTGAPSAVLVDLYGSLNGVNWFKIGSWDSGSVTDGDIVFFTGKPIIQAYLKLTTLTGGTSPTVSAWVAAQ